MRRVYDHEVKILQEPATATIAAALISAGSTKYASDKAEDAQEEAARKAEEARAKAEAEAQRVASETAPEQESATVKFGKETGDIGSSMDFLIPKTSVSKLGASTTGAGLGA